MASAQLIQKPPALDGYDPAAKTFAPADTGVHFDACFPAHGPAKIRNTNEQAVYAWRRDLEPVGTLEQILNIERRRQRFAHRLAILDGHRSIWPFRDDLHRHSRLQGELCTDQPVSQSLKNGFRYMRNTCSRASLRDQTGLAQRALRFWQLSAHAIRILPIRRRYDTP